MLEDDWEPSPFCRLCLVARLLKYQCLKVTGGEAIESQEIIDAWRWPVARLLKSMLKDDQWWGYQMSEYQSMLEDDQWQGYQISMLQDDQGPPFCRLHVRLVASLSKVRVYRPKLEDNWGQGYHISMLEGDREPSPFCRLHVRLVAMLSKVGEYRSMLEDDRSENINAERWLGVRLSNIDAWKWPGSSAFCRLHIRLARLLNIYAWRQPVARLSKGGEYWSLKMTVGPPLFVHCVR